MSLKVCQPLLAACEASIAHSECETAHSLPRKLSIREAFPGERSLAGRGVACRFARIVPRITALWGAWHERARLQGSAKGTAALPLLCNVGFVCATLLFVRNVPMTAHAVIPQAPAGKVEAKSGPSPAASQKPTSDSRPSVYWGDRFTLRFWLLCFGFMAAITLFEAAHRFVHYLFGSSPSP